MASPSVAETIRGRRSVRHSARRFRPDPLSVGYPAEQRSHPGRLPLSRLAFGDRYGESL